MQGFANSILVSENGIATANFEKRENAFNILVTFLMSFASITERTRQVKYFYNEL